jgi:hypothetical protein
MQSKAIRDGGLNCWSSYIRPQPSETPVLPDRQDLQRVRQWSVVRSETKFADPDVMVQFPAA